MAEQTLTVGELKALLKGLPADMPLYLQDVRSGVTYRLPIGASEGDPADGKLAWIWVKGAAEPPEWMASRSAQAETEATTNEPLRQFFDVISNDDEIQAIHVMLQALRGVPAWHMGTGLPPSLDSAMRIVEYVKSRVALAHERGISI